MTRIKGFLFVIIGLCCLSACNPLINLAQPTQADLATITPQNNIGQSIMTTFRGFQGIAVYLAPRAPLSGTLRLHLRSAPDATDDISVADVPLDKIKKPQFVAFSFPLQIDSFKKDYYFYIELLGSGEIGIGKAPGDTYLNGAMYVNHFAEDAQLTFRLKYDRYQALIGIIIEIITWLSFSVISILIYILPGWALMSLIYSHWSDLVWGEKLGLAAGLSLAIYPILILWTHMIGLQLGSFYAFIPAAFGIATLGWKNRKKLPLRPIKITYTQNTLPDATFLIVILMVIAVRFWVIRTLDAPMWGDSVQHTVMAQLMLDHGGLFTSWEPYAPYNSLTVQFGFPVFSALFAWLSGLDSVKATLIVGQIINGLCVIVLYPLAIKFKKTNRWLGVGVILVVGLLSPMPAFYVNWGRYAQLAGQAVLPVALWMIWEALEERGIQTERPSQSFFMKPQLSIIGLSALTLAGMIISYYRMQFYYITFTIALLVGWGIPMWKFKLRIWSRKLCILLAIASGAGVLILPWVPNLFGSHLGAMLEKGVVSGIPVDTIRTDYQAWNTLFLYVPKTMVIITLIGLAWSLIQKRWVVSALGLWVLLLSAVRAGGLIHLPGANLMQTFAILIALYIPIGLVIGWMIAELTELVSGRLFQWLIPVACLVVAVMGLISQSSITEPSTFAYINRPDTRAMVWILENIPNEARFLVEGYSIYNHRSIVGGDAGWWIPLLTHRQNTMPPQYAIMNESTIQPNYSQRMVALVNNLETVSLDSLEGVNLLCNEGVSHIYIGQGQGKVGYNAIQLFSPSELQLSQKYRLLYHQDRVYVYSLKPDTCPVQ